VVYLGFNPVLSGEKITDSKIGSTSLNIVQMSMKHIKITPNANTMYFVVISCHSG